MKKEIIFQCKGCKGWKKTHSTQRRGVLEHKTSLLLKGTHLHPRLEPERLACTLAQCPTKPSKQACTLAQCPASPSVSSCQSRRHCLTQDLLLPIPQPSLSQASSTSVRFRHQASRFSHLSKKRTREQRDIFRSYPKLSWATYSHPNFLYNINH